MGGAAKPAGTVAYNLLCVEGTPTSQMRAFTAPISYVLLFLLGVLEGLIGCFQFSRGMGGVPVAALGFCLLIFVTCLLAGIGMGSPLGGLAPAVGWFAASFILTLPTPGGSVIVTNTSAGKWYLYGGAVSASVGCLLTFHGRLRHPPRSPGTGPGDIQ